MLQAAMERERAVLAYSDVTAVDDEGKLLARSLRELRPRLTYLEGSDLAPKLFFRNCVAGCAMLVNSNIAKRAIPFPRQTVCDHWIALLAATEGTVAFVPDQLVRYRQHKRNQTGVLAGVSDKQSYLRYKVAPLEERLTCYRQYTVPQEEIEAFARARIGGRIIMIWKYRALAPHEAEFEIAAHLLPDGLISWMLRRVK